MQISKSKEIENFVIEMQLDLNATGEHMSIEIVKLAHAQLGY
jgi:hypothetical protein